MGDPETNLFCRLVRQRTRIGMSDYALVVLGLLFAIGAVSDPRAPTTLLLCLPVLHFILSWSAFQLPAKLRRLDLVETLSVLPLDGSLYAQAYLQVFWRSTLVCAATVLPGLIVGAVPGALSLALTGSARDHLFLLLWLAPTVFVVQWLNFWTVIRFGVPAFLLLAPLHIIAVLIPAGFLALLALPWLGVPGAAVLLFGGSGGLWYLGYCLYRGVVEHHGSELRKRWACG